MDSTREYEMPFRPDDVNAIRNFLVPAYNSDQIHMQEDDLGYTFIEKPLWSQDENTKRMFFVGNGHGDITGFTEVYLSMRNPQKPLNVVNFDLHVDHAMHTDQHDLFASWQRDFYERKYTTFQSSWNVFPSLEWVQISPIVQCIDPEGFLEFPNKFFDIVSIDLDVFNGHSLDAPESKLLMQAIEQSIDSAKSVMVFISPMFSKHKEEEKITRLLFNKAIPKPVEPR
jgi:hypothetical protein